MRRPVRTITRPPISSRRIRFGEPTSPRSSGVIVAAFRPSPCSRIAAAASCTTAFCVARRDRARGRSAGSRARARSRRARARAATPRAAPARSGRPRGRRSSRSSTAPEVTGARSAVRPTAMARTGGWRRRGTKSARLSLRRRAGSRSPTTRARADRRAGDPAGVARRLDLAASAREAPGDRARQGGPQAVPLLRGLPRAAGAGEVRQARPLRREAAGDPRRRCPRTWTRPSRPRARLRDRASADQPRLVSAGLRALCEGIAHVRNHDAPKAPREGPREPDRAQLPRQAQGLGPHACSTPSSPTR